MILRERNRRFDEDFRTFLCCALRLSAVDTLLHVRSHHIAPPFSYTHAIIHHPSFSLLYPDYVPPFLACNMYYFPFHPSVVCTYYLTYPTYYALANFHLLYFSHSFPFCLFFFIYC